MNFYKEQELTFLDTCTPASVADYKKHIQLMRDNNLFEKSEEEIHQLFIDKYPNIRTRKKHTDKISKLMKSIDKARYEYWHNVYSKYKLEMKANQDEKLKTETIYDVNDLL